MPFVGGTSQGQPLGAILPMGLHISGDHEAPHSHNMCVSGRLGFGSDIARDRVICVRAALNRLSIARVRYPFGSSPSPRLVLGYVAYDDPVARSTRPSFGTGRRRVTGCRRCPGRSRAGCRRQPHCVVWCHVRVEAFFADGVGVRSRVHDRGDPIAGRAILCGITTFATYRMLEIQTRRFFFQDKLSGD